MVVWLYIPVWNGTAIYISSGNDLYLMSPGIHFTNVSSGYCWNLVKIPFSLNLMLIIQCPWYNRWSSVPCTKLWPYLLTSYFMLQSPVWDGFHYHYLPDSFLCPVRWVPLPLSVRFIYLPCEMGPITTICQINSSALWDGSHYHYLPD